MTTDKARELAREIWREWQRPEGMTIEDALTEAIESTERRKDEEARATIAAAYRDAGLLVCSYCRDEVPFTNSSKLIHDNSANTSPASSRCYIYPECNAYRIVSHTPADARAALDAYVAERVREAQDDIFVALCNAIGERPFTWDTKKNEESAKLFVERIVKEAVGKELSDAIGNAAAIAEEHARLILRRELDMLHTRLQQAEAELSRMVEIVGESSLGADPEAPTEENKKHFLAWTDKYHAMEAELATLRRQQKALLDALEERLEVWRNRITSIRVMFPGDQAPIEICADELESLLREHGRLG